MSAYAEPAELLRVLQIQTPTEAQRAAAERVLEAAADEIDHYLARVTPLTEPYPSIVVTVNIERATELWKYEQSPTGIVAIGGGGGETHYNQSNTFARHTYQLLSLKQRWGVA